MTAPRTQATDLAGLVERLRTTWGPADLLALRRLSEGEFEHLLFIVRTEIAEDERLAAILLGRAEQ